jgi:hypothetical protein
VILQVTELINTNRTDASSTGITEPFILFLTENNLIREAFEGGNDGMIIAVKPAKRVSDNQGSLSIDQERKRFQYLTCVQHEETKGNFWIIR